LSVKEVNKMRKSDKQYQERWAKFIYNSEKYSLFEKASPNISFEYNAVWPQNVGIWDVKSLLRKYMAVPY
jgi:hypothetical protein